MASPEKPRREIGFHVREKPPHLRCGENGRQSHRPLRPHEIAEPGQIPAEHVLVEKEQRRERLVLRGRRHLPVTREVVQKRRYLLGAELSGMALAGEIDKALDPMDVRFLRAVAVVQSPNSVTHALE